MKPLDLSRIYLAALLVTVSLQGCAVFRPVGQENFDCSGRKSTDPYCRSIKGIDRSTMGSIPDTRFDKPFDYLSFSRYHGEQDEEGSNAEGAKAVTKDQTTLLPHESGKSSPVIPGAPVRAASVIQKVWFNRHIDTNDRLYQQNEIYQEVMGPKWVGANAPARSTKDDGSASSYPHKPVKDVAPNDNGTKVGTTELPNAPMPAAVAEPTNQVLSNPQ